MSDVNSADVAQTVILPQSKDAIFLTVTIRGGGEAAAVDALTGLSGLVDAVGFRWPEANLSAVAGIGAALWDRLFSVEKPEHLHEFVALQGAKHAAPSTAGDLFFHIRADAYDVAFELARRICGVLGEAIGTYDEVHAFKYQDFRDPLGFVDGTESPRGRGGVEAALIPDGPWAGGSYIVLQKYVHDLTAWDATPVGEQERVIGRTKHGDVELDDAVKPANSHVAVNTVEDAEGNELEIVRDNLSFGEAAGQQGTFFISYARDVRITEVMLRRMFIGEPAGNYDRILDFSTALTGCNFFAPPKAFLDAADTHVREGVLSAEKDTDTDPAQPATDLPRGREAYGGATTTGPRRPGTDGSLGIGSLKEN